MTTQAWTTLIACVGELAVAVLVLLRAFRSPLAMPLLLLSVDLFAWNFAQLGWQRSRELNWHLADMVASPLGTAFAFHFMLVFLGRSRQLRAILVVAYLSSGLLSVTAAVALFSPMARQITMSRVWPTAFLVCLLPLTVLTVGLILVHRRRVVSVEERTRTDLLLAALVILSPLASTELWADLGWGVPRLGSVGIFTFNVILCVAALRFRLFDRAPSPAAALTAMLLGAVGVVAYLSVFRFFQTSVAMLVFGTATITLILLAATRFVVGTILQRRHHVVQLATLGRLAAQMGHDLKNPLAALKGAAQFLREERAQGRSIDDRTEFLELLIEQIERVKTVIDRYQRLGRVEPVRVPLQLNDLVRHLVVLQKFADPGGGIAIKTELASGLPACRVDGDLVAGALENLLQNAFEAVPPAPQGLPHPADQAGATQAGRQAAMVPVAMTVTVRTTLTSNRQARGVTLSVEDTGAGMNARTRERALDEFFTTKVSGSGLGLAFVRRVAEAHGGEVSLLSKEGVGTTVRVFLPLE